MAFTLPTGVTVLNLPEQVAANVDDIADLNTKLDAIGTSQTASTEAANTATTTANTALSTANTAKTTADEAIELANAVQGAQTTADEALANANTAITNANNAVTTANNAQQTAEEFYNANISVVQEAQAALENISTTNDAAFGANVEVDGDLTLNSRDNIKLTETPTDTLALSSELTADYNALDTKIEANTTLIGTKADSSAVTALESSKASASELSYFEQDYYAHVGFRCYEGRNPITLTSSMGRKGDPDTTATSYDYELPSPVKSGYEARVTDWRFAWYNTTLQYYLGDYQTHDLYTPIFGNCSAFHAFRITWSTDYNGTWTGRLYLRATGKVGNYRLFANGNATYIGPSKVDGEFTGGFNWNPLYNEMFANNSNLTEIGAFDFSGCSVMESCFSSCPKLKSIHITHFQVSFDISGSTQYEESDLVEIIGNLDTVSTAQTLTMGSTNLAKLTTDEILVATGKGWTLA